MTPSARLLFFPKHVKYLELNINILCKLITLPLRLPNLLGVRMRAPQNETSGSVRINEGINEIIESYENHKMEAK